MTLKDETSTIWRCAHCGLLVHPADDAAPAAWCGRCRGFTPATPDGARPSRS